MASKRIKVLTSLTALGFSVSLLLPYSTVYGAVNNEGSAKLTKRISGSNRYGTSAEVSKTGWEEGSQYAVIASGDDYADALCAAPLAKKFNAPILLTSKGSTSPEVLAELKRLNAKNIIIVGGEGAVSKEVVSSIQKVNSAIKIERLQGKDRYATSVKVAEKMGTDKIVVATGKSYADALSMASIAAEEGMPILLTEKTALPESVKAFLKGKTLGKTFIIGGTGVVSSDIEKQFKNVERLGGIDRYETNQKVLEAFSSRIDFKKVYVTVGGPSDKDFADALSASAIAVKTASPIIIVDKNSKVSSYTKALAEENMLPGSEVITIGGEKVLPESKANSIKIKATTFNEEGVVVGNEDKTKTENYNENVEVKGNKITLQNANVSKNLYVEGNSGVIKNVKVSGTLVVHPGKDGVTTLENVEASKIKVLSGANKSVHLKNVKADLVEVKSKNEVRVVFEGNTSVKETKLDSASMLEVKEGAKSGKVIVGKTIGDEVITLKGAIQEVVVEDSIKQLVLADNTVVGRIVAETNVEVKTGNNVEVKEVQAAKDAEVKPADSTTKLPETKPIDETTPPEVNVPSTGGTSSGSVTPVTPVTPTEETKIEKTVALDLGDLSLYKDKTVEELFGIVKTKTPDAGYKDIVNRFMTAYSTLSSEKNKLKTELNITSHNGITIENTVFGAFGITVGDKSELDLVKELQDKVINDGLTLDQIISKIKSVNKVEVPYLVANGTKYTASKVTVMFGSTKVYETGTNEDGVDKSGNIDYAKLSQKAQEILGTSDFKAMTLEKLAAKGGNNIKVITEFKDQTGKKTLIINSGLTFQAN
ncbi:cell wall-binding repeat-containing protein [Haloimpatiens sp. FM7315]|uniref:cell wall-binding repeat-containing protein n=1 Tax=Haloimpatiens sp. FM7315 TaxID=3298609 RepID=UPI0035A374CB